MKNFVLFGGNSEFCKTFIDLSKHKGYKVWGVSRKKIDNLSIDNQLLVSDYFKESTRILDFLKKIDQPYIFFFNGFLAENRPSYSPNIKEIKKTFEINYLIPVELTFIIKQAIKIQKFVYISSMAALKPRYKNYIYGISKKYLEDSIKQQSNLNYLIIRFGQIHTTMSEDHPKAPFSLSKEKASMKLIKLVDQSGKKYATKSLFLSSLILRVLPIKLINFIEEKR